jgi:outer membrane protein OmpA-like peptidoglycan-associated protein
VFSFPALSQVELSTKSKKAIELYTIADNFRVRGQFEEALNLLSQALARDKNFVEAYYRRGLTYFSMKQYPRAIEDYEKGLSLTADVRKQKVFWYDLGELYLLSGQYDKAKDVLNAFLKNESQNKQKIDRAAAILKSAEFASNNKSGKSYKRRVLSDTVNRFVMQYFPVLTADQKQLIFTRRAGDGPNDDEDLMVSKKDEQGRWMEPESISKNINTPLNEGTCSISADGRRLIFTSCSGRDGIGSCDLYESVKEGDVWTTPKNLGRNVNTSEWESQPSLSADGRTLYFVSDRRSGIGRRDIWISTLSDETGTWTKAINAGEQINSPFDEISPFIHANDRTLYFASNGLPGFGGYDVFYAERDSTDWGNPENIGNLINDHEDQFSFFITAEGKKGYYSHEETLPTGVSRSKLYEIEIPAENQVRYRSNYVKGIIRDKVSKSPLKARIELINIDRNKRISLVESDSTTGDYLMVLTQGAEYALYISKKGYLFKSYNFNYSAIKDFEPIVINIDLEKAMAGSRVVLNNLFFDVDKYDLKPKSIPELEKIIRFMKENPHIQVEISGHTDNSGQAAYNKQLSERRALAVFQYLTRKGIDKNRLVPIGHGPDKPLAPNDSEDGRQQNRRIEFRIIK